MIYHLNEKLTMLHSKFFNLKSKCSNPGENLIPNAESHANFQRENENNDSDAQSEFKDVNTELDPTYDPKYPSLAKWTKDHPKYQVIGVAYSGVLTRSQ